MSPFFGKMRQANSRSGCEGRLSGFRWVNPCPHRGERHLGAAVGAPQSPTLRAAVAAQAARGRPGPRVGPGPAPPSRPPPPNPFRTQRPSPRPSGWERVLPGRRREARREQPPFSQGTVQSPANPLTHLQGKASRRLRAAPPPRKSTRPAA